MHTGLLWFADRKKPLAANIETAVKYYEKKYGIKPDTILVHPSMMEGNIHLSLTMNVRPYRPVLPGHLWIGMEEPVTNEG